MRKRYPHLQNYKKINFLIISPLCRIESAFIIMWRRLYFSSSIEDMIMQKCKLQFDQNKRINSKHSTLKPPSLTACSSCRLCPGPGNKDKCKFVLFSNCQIINLSWTDHKKITILTMLRLSVSIGNGNTMVELCSVDMALSVCNNHNNDNHLIITIIIFD